MGCGVGLRFFSSSNCVMSEMSTLAKEVSLRSNFLGVLLLLLLMLLLAGLSFVAAWLLLLSLVVVVVVVVVVAWRWGLGCCSVAAGLLSDVGLG